ncbi:MAG: type II toxin-antitoxin system RelE/ParE family toxin [Chloroflexi bacterium]|nr:type II toxin-antitoxin system RelE/ParE family toxin [Chloroflexota bacterium]
MKYKIVFTRRAAKDISNLDPEVKDRIKEALIKYSEDPLSYARKMVDPSLGTYRFRIGDYRIIFDIAGEEIVILRVGHRGEIYRR